MFHRAHIFFWVFNWLIIYIPGQCGCFQSKNELKSIKSEYSNEQQRVELRVTRSPQNEHTEEPQSQLPNQPEPPATVKTPCTIHLQSDDDFNTNNQERDYRKELIDSFLDGRIEKNVTHSPYTSTISTKPFTPSPLNCRARNKNQKHKGARVSNQHPSFSIGDRNDLLITAVENMIRNNTRVAVMDGTQYAGLNAKILVGNIDLLRREDYFIQQEIKPLSAAGTNVLIKLDVVRFENSSRFVSDILRQHHQISFEFCSIPFLRPRKKAVCILDTKNNKEKWEFKLWAQSKETLFEDHDKYSVGQIIALMINSPFCTYIRKITICNP